MPPIPVAGKVALLEGSEGGHASQAARYAGSSGMHTPGLAPHTLIRARTGDARQSRDTETPRDERETDRGMGRLSINQRIRTTGESRRRGGSGAAAELPGAFYGIHGETASLSQHSRSEDLARSPRSSQLESSLRAARRAAPRGGGPPMSARRPRWYRISNTRVDQVQQSAVSTHSRHDSGLSTTVTRTNN